MFRILYKVFFRGVSILSEKCTWIITLIKFYGNGVKFSYDFISRGVPIIRVALSGKVFIGKGFNLNSGTFQNVIGRQQPTYFVVGNNAELTIGNYVGISCSAIVCFKSIRIEDHVKIGGNVVIYDTDFHSINELERNQIPENLDNVKSKPVVIKRGVFIGAHSTILKGVTIGEGAVIGAGSVVSRDIPANEVWAGNPARFIKKLAFD